MHAARHYGVEAVGITLSEQQRSLAEERIADAGLDRRCHVELRDYRDAPSLGPFDKIASVGMVEHVGVERLGEYFSSLAKALTPGGLFLNHGIVRVGGGRDLDGASAWSVASGAATHSSRSTSSPTDGSGPTTRSSPPLKMRSSRRATWKAFASITH